MEVHPETTRFGVFHGDNTGFAASCAKLAEMLEHEGRNDDAQGWHRISDEILARLDKVSCIEIGAPLSAWRHTISCLGSRAHCRGSSRNRVHRFCPGNGRARAWQGQTADHGVGKRIHLANLLLHIAILIILDISAIRHSSYFQTYLRPYPSFWPH